MTDARSETPKWVTSWPEWFGIHGNVTVVPKSDYDIMERERDALRAKLAEAEAEVARLRQDAERFAFVLPIVTADDSPETNARMLRLGASLMIGLDGRAAIDDARGWKAK